ncbi:Chaperone for flagella basal body P-ring formation [Nakamurella panacisegetis]|uniref:Chaperone for flagella basal body P-ring formation n=1 Tax=Nakamurella panacisegetis TaxID=1090615 RepID=A0A1H0I6A4_9ACTN|nr:hypothetical protein [Nakamurella panacisegetis]SDO26947.1 Chaperone for flagella basal body P-ring formation [Nakamurella panacisegetis]
MKATTAEGAPVPRRTSRPKWLDIRVIGGLVLVIAAVVVGARVVGASSHTSPVWSVTRDLAPGTVITAADLERVDVNLGDQAARYVAAGGGSAAVGTAVAVQLHAGELLPVSAITVSKPGRVVVIGVTPDHMPPGVTHGSVIDLYLTTGGATAATTAVTDLVSAGVTVQSVSAPASGGLSGASSTRYQIAVLVSAALADSLVKTLPKGDAIVVLQTGER